MAQDTRFARLVSLACHDLRTPLATVHGFARTLERVELAEPAPRYVEMIAAASGQMAELLDELSLLASVERGSYDPTLVEADSLELARGAAEELDAGRLVVSGEGARVRVEPRAAQRSLRQLARAATRHGGLDSIELVVRGTELELFPIAPTAGPVVLGEELRDLGALAAAAYVRATGGSIELDGDRLHVRLPSATAP